MRRFLVLLMAASELMTSSTSAIEPTRRLQSAGSATLSDQATADLMAGRYLDAAAKFDQAWRDDPSKPLRLRYAGIAWQEAGMLAAARERFLQYLTLNPPDVERDDVKARIVEIDSALANAAPSSSTHPSPTSSGASSQPNWPALATLSGGAVLVGTGIGLLAWASGQQDLLDMGGTDERGEVMGSRAAGGVCLALGLAAAGVGAYWMVTHGPRLTGTDAQAGKVTIVPGPTSLVVRF